MVDPGDLRDVDAERIEEALPDRPITSLRGIEALYGELYTLAEAGSRKYAKYLSPHAANDLLGTDESVLVVRIDLRGETPQLDATSPVEIHPYYEDLVPLLAHSKYASARGVDHSLTHQSGQDNSPEQLATHATDRFTRWPTEDAIREIADEYDDGWLTNTLAELGDDDETMATVDEAVQRELDDDRTMLVTIAIAVDVNEHNVATTEVYESDKAYHYPGEFEVFQEAMAARKTRKFKAKNAATEAVGEGVGFVTGSEEQVYGVVDDPMKSYLSKQAEKFPRFDSDESWRTQPLSRDTAIAAQNADTFLDACEYSGAGGASVYYLPYLRKVPTARSARRLFELLAELTEGTDDAIRTPIERAYEDYPESQEALRYAVLVVHKYQKDRWRLLAGSTDVSVVATSGLGAAHRNVLTSPLFGEYGAFPTVDTWDLLDDSRTGSWYTGLVSSPGYFFRTCAETDEDDPSADDLRFRATVEALSNGTIPVESLLESYVERLSQQFDPTDDHFPDRLVASQYAQLSALATQGLLEANGETTDLAKPPDMTPDTNETEPHQSRTDKLDDFIDRHPALAGESNYARRGAFVLGALVGRMTQYQRYEGKSMTAVKQHPVDGLTKHNIGRTATDVVDLNITYSSDGDGSRIRDELMGRVADDLQHRDPENWDITTEDLRFHYAMGIAYGLNDTTTTETNDD